MAQFAVAGDVGHMAYLELEGRTQKAAGGTCAMTAPRLCRRISSQRIEAVGGVLRSGSAGAPRPIFWWNCPRRAMPSHPAKVLAAALVAALVAAHAPQAASAQGDGGMAGDGVAEELRQIRAQMEANRRSEALFWESFGAGVVIAAIVAVGTAYSVWYLRKQANLLASDMRGRLRPAIARTRCYVEQEGKTGAEESMRRLVFEITNVGEVSAVEVDGYVRFGVGEGLNTPGRARAFGLPIGAIVPTSSETIVVGVDPDWIPMHGADPFRFEIVLEYKSVGGKSFTYVASGALYNGYIRLQETPYSKHARAPQIIDVDVKG